MVLSSVKYYKVLLSIVKFLVKCINKAIIKKKASVCVIHQSRNITLGLELTSRYRAQPGLIITMALPAVSLHLLKLHINRWANDKILTTISVVVKK